MIDEEKPSRTTESIADAMFYCRCCGYHRFHEGTESNIYTERVREKLKSIVDLKEDIYCTAKEALEICNKCDVKKGRGIYDQWLIGMLSCLLISTPVDLRTQENPFFKKRKYPL